MTLADPQFLASHTTRVELSWTFYQALELSWPRFYISDVDLTCLSWMYQEPLNSYLDREAIQKIWKRCFLGNIWNSFCWVTQMGLKPTQKTFFKKISKNTAARGVQNFGLIEGAAELPLKQWQIFDLKLAHSYDKDMLRIWKR